MDVSALYSTLFRTLEDEYGPIDEDTETSIVGFTAGGPVSLSSIRAHDVFITCELALHPEQQASAEGLRFELGSAGHFSLEESREILTAVGDLSLGAELGSGHRVGVAGAFDGTIELSLHSQCVFDGQAYGVYFIQPVAVAA